LELPTPGEITVEAWDYLTCYETPEHKVYPIVTLTSVNCQQLATPVEDKLMESTSFNISPNPTSGPATLDYTLPPGTAANVQIFNSYGQLVQKHRLQNDTGALQIDGLRPGLYLVVLESGGVPVMTKKLVRF